MQTTTEYAQGKSVLCAKIVESLQESATNKVFYFICTSSITDSNPCAKTFRTLAAQALRASPESSAWIYDRFISQNLVPSLTQLRILLPTLLSVLPSTRIVLDGLDELEANEHKPILSELVSLVGNKQLSEGSCKILISSRDVPQISRMLGRRAQISLNEEHQAIKGAIQSFVDSSVQNLQDNLDGIDLEGDAMKSIRTALVDKAEGLKPTSIDDRKVLIRVKACSYGCSLWWRRSKIVTVLRKCFRRSAHFRRG